MRLRFFGGQVGLPSLPSVCMVGGEGGSQGQEAHLGPDGGNDINSYPSIFASMEFTHTRLLYSNIGGREIELSSEMKKTMEKKTT